MAMVKMIEKYGGGVNLDLCCTTHSEKTINLFTISGFVPQTKWCEIPRSRLYCSSGPAELSVKNRYFKAD